MQKLKHEHKHIMKLIEKDIGEDGWTPVSAVLYPVFLKSMPSELVEFEHTPPGGRARLTKEGQNVMSAMAWL
jgi:DNA-binding PadR family transcriptional regulator